MQVTHALIYASTHGDMYTYAYAIVGAAHITGHERRMLMNVTPDLLPQQHISALSFSLSFSVHVALRQEPVFMPVWLTTLCHVYQIHPITKIQLSGRRGYPHVLFRRVKIDFRLKKILLLRGKANKDRRCVGGWM